MNREVRFRGKEISSGEWVYGAYFCLHHNDGRQHIHHFIIPDDIPIPKDKPIGEMQVEVDPATVGQYTGLKDKNGKEIYEGDILHHKWNSGNDIFLETISEVKFSRGAFVVDDKKRADWLLSLHALPKWAEIEVIGNIHENPGLLEKPSC